MLSGKRLLTVMLLVTLLLIPACSGGESTAQKPAQQTKKPQLPEQFLIVVKETDNIIKEVDKKIKLDNYSILESSDNSQNEDADKQETNKSNSGQDRANSMLNNWQKEQTSLKSIHRNWNKLQVKATQAGLNMESRQKFDQSLDLLTDSINAKNTEDTIIQSIELYDGFDSIAQVFNSSIPPVYYQTKYEIMKASALAMQGRWEEGKKQCQHMLREWNTLKMQSDKIDNQVVSCTDASVRDLCRAIDNKSVGLVSIKTDIAIENMNKLFKEFNRNNMTH
ncbi:MAG: hypothetical protein PHD40_05640 [Syntrophomonadaceae bacterium]|nr:hypothetical protein [Syntrophomonadaceae bacterium]